MMLTRLIFESFSLATRSLRVNKLRTFLSLLGVTVGIFAIISVFTIIDSLEIQFHKSLNSLGGNMVFVEKWPLTIPEGETEYPFWRYANRPALKLEEVDKLKKRTNTIKDAAFLFRFNRIVKSGNDAIENCRIIASSYDLYDVWNLKLDQGRYFTENEIKSGAPVTLIGAKIASQLFPNINPVGRTIKVQGYKLKIIGVYEKRGQDIFQTSLDNYVHVSLIKSFYMVDLKNRDSGQSICIKPKPGIDLNQFKAELEGAMRAIRQLKPMEENDFAINEVSLISKGFDQIFSALNVAGAIIGGFSILVGGFGIANIMFVSVKERTKIIGIQKSMGAKRYFILLQFIFEAIALSLIGGVVGLLLIYFGSFIVSYIADFDIILTAGNIVKGLLISSTIGFLAGFMPAQAAARLDPVIAINSV